MDKGYLYYPFYQAPARYRERGVWVKLLLLLYCSWAPKGQLVAHIHDHLQAVNK